MAGLLDGVKPCHCSRGNCFRNLTAHLDAVLEFLGKFYSLDKLDQDEFVASAKT